MICPAGCHSDCKWKPIFYGVSQNITVLSLRNCPFSYKPIKNEDIRYKTDEELEREARRSINRRSAAEHQQRLNEQQRDKDDRTKQEVERWRSEQKRRETETYLKIAVGERKKRKLEESRLKRAIVVDAIRSRTCTFKQIMSALYVWICNHS